jgi:hypothetical protein
MFTMVLSVVVYDHKLTFGQWAGAGIVFAGISVEAWVKRKGQCLVFIQVPWRFISFFQRSMQNVFYRRRRRQRSNHYKSCSVETWIMSDTSRTYTIHHHSANPSKIKYTVTVE